MKYKNKAFTLLELIIVIAIIGVLTLIVVPKYYGFVAKAQRAQVFTYLDDIRQGLLAYYAVYGVYDSSFPITVNLDGDTVVNVLNPSNTSWGYEMGLSGHVNCSPSWYITARNTSSGCRYNICVETGGEYGGSSCTP
ncbi:MAG: prepilin-type N-terminal cleavage/methylation domain-containing protein [Candidatus Omnitrophica bacterium]|nr:prepilin-type N-terminal cleavage/methylation domain-containing protein [Candidatus Omnitrophota bacterium]